MALNVKQKETKELAVAILESQGKDYDAEMTAWHNKVISDNQKVILESLKKAAKDRNNKQSGGQQNG